MATPRLVGVDQSGPPTARKLAQLGPRADIYFGCLLTEQDKHDVPAQRLPCGLVGSWVFGQVRKLLVAYLGYSPHTSPHKWSTLLLLGNTSGVFRLLTWQRRSKLAEESVHTIPSFMAQDWIPGFMAQDCLPRVTGLITQSSWHRT